MENIKSARGEMCLTTSNYPTKNYFPRGMRLMIEKKSAEGTLEIELSILEIKTRREKIWRGCRRCREFIIPFFSQ